VGRLACGLAHDLNNLLTVISGNSEMLLRRMPSVDAQAAGQAREIQKAAQLGAAITRQLLCLCRARPLTLEPVQVAGAVRKLEILLKRLLGKATALAVTLLPDLPAVYLAPGQLEQILLNLTLNARDAMPQGGQVTIEAARAAGASEATGVRITVRDTGCGMDAATQARVFEPFFSTKGSEGGTGLGLATVRDLVQAAGGTVALESRPQHGTVVRVWLPECR
jgi:signal transduction histidine kinase